MPVPRDRLQVAPYRHSAPFSYKPNRAAVSFGGCSYLRQRAASIPGIGHLNLDISGPGLHCVPRSLPIVHHLAAPVFQASISKRVQELGQF